MGFIKKWRKRKATEERVEALWAEWDYLRDAVIRYWDNEYLSDMLILLMEERREEIRQLERELEK